MSALNHKSQKNVEKSKLASDSVGSLAKNGATDRWPLVGCAGADSEDEEESDEGKSNSGGDHFDDFGFWAAGKKNSIF